MSGEDLRPDPVFDKLGRFTPDPSGIDRDEWLFQAGRASVRTSRAWKWLAGLLATMQALTVAAWVGYREPPSPSPVVSPPPAAKPAPPVDEPYDPAPGSIAWITRRFDSDLPPPPPGSDNPASPNAVLTAGSRGEIQ
jgi:hypothetical protein